MAQDVQVAYEITANTMALISRFHEGDGRPFTRVLETDGEVDVEERCYRIMNENCRDNGSCYKGREEGTRKVTDFRKRLPIVVSEALDLYAFPLRSPRHPECIWVLHDHFLSVEGKETGGSIIVFKNGVRLPVGVSKGVVDISYKKASHLRYCFSNRIAEKKVFYQTKGHHLPI